MKNKYEIFLDTEIFIEYLSEVRSKEESLLLKCRRIFEGCYTSVINASEVFSEFPDKRNSVKVKNAFANIGILGIPFRYSEKIGKVMSAIKKKEQETLLETLWLYQCAQKLSCHF